MNIAAGRMASSLLAILQPDHVEGPAAIALPFTSGLTFLHRRGLRERQEPPMSHLAFRYALRSDAPAIVDLIERAYRGPDAADKWTSEAGLLTGPRTSREEILDLVGREDSRFVLAEENGKLMGCCLVQGLSREEASAAPINAAYFGMFAIEPDRHGSGLGKLVIAEAERRVQDLWGANQMVMTVINLRGPLIAWYERRGYRLTGATLPFPFSETSGETRRDFHLVEMRKNLA
jgi:ribosomal protein S18 acetylase RimI-like enzyme